MRKYFKIFFLFLFIQPVLVIALSELFSVNNVISLFAVNKPKTTNESKDDNLHYNKGVLAAENNEFDVALKELDTALTINPKNTFALYARSTVYYQTGNFDSALIDLNNLLKLEPKNVQGLYLRSNIFSNLEKYINAINDYEQLIKLEPKNYKHYVNLGYCYQVTKNPEKALKNYLKAEELGADEIEIKINLANLYYTKKNYDKSLEYVRKVLTNDKGNPQIYSLYIYLFINKNQCDDALKVFNLYKDDIQNPSRVLTDIGICSFNEKSKKSDSTSLDCFVEAAKLDSTAIVNFYYLGATYLKLDNTLEAQVQFEKFLLVSEHKEGLSKEKTKARKQVAILKEINKNKK